MRSEIFGQQINRLRDVYGDRAYSDERVKVLWREVKELSEPWFERIVDELIGSSRNAPLLPDFRMFIARERERQEAARRPAEAEWVPNENACVYCFGAGVFLCHSRTKGGVWAFRCHCPIGLADRRIGIPQFKADHAEDFYWIDGRKLKSA